MGEKKSSRRGRVNHADAIKSSYYLTWVASSSHCNKNSSLRLIHLSPEEVNSVHLQGFNVEMMGDACELLLHVHHLQQLVKEKNVRPSPPSSRARVQAHGRQTSGERRAAPPFSKYTFSIRAPVSGEPTGPLI